MAGSLNKVILVGNVGKDPEIRSSNDGREIATFSLATSDTWRDKATGEKRERTEWHRIVIFSDGLVGVVKNYVKKGSKLYVEGSLQTRKWVDNTGVEKYTTEIVLQNFSSSLILLDSKGSEEYIDNAASKNVPSGPSSFNHSELDDEIPF